MTLDRAQDKIAQMQARAGAIDELLDTGALPDALGGGGDDIQKQLDATSQAGQVDSELAALKAELGAGTPSASLPPGGAPGTNGAPSGTASGNGAPPRGRRRLMIVRILGEGRYDVPDADMPAIEQLDAQLTDALDRGDEAEFAVDPGRPHRPGPPHRHPARRPTTCARRRWSCPTRARPWPRCRALLAEGA